MPGGGITESWNGSSWTEVGDLNTARTSGGSSGTSSISALYSGGGVPGNSAKTESWDGTSWTEVADLATARSVIREGAGTAPAGLAVGGLPGATNATEEFTKPDFQIKSVTTS